MDFIVLNRFGEIKRPNEISVERVVLSSMSPKQRVNNISGFLQEKSYQQLFVEVQEVILKEGKRSNISKGEVLKLIDKIILVSGNVEAENNLTRHELDAIRDFSNDIEVNLKLLTAFKNAKTDSLKYQLIWDILEFDELQEATHDELFAYYLNHIEVFSEYSRKWYALHDDERFFDILRGRIESNKGYNPKKKWIYLCDLYAVRELTELENFFEGVIAGKVEQVNYEFAKIVAKRIMAKIKNEKNNHISVA